MGAVPFVAATFAIPGVAIGSFLNVLVSRMPLRLPIGTSRSRCMSCSTEIAARDNVPIISYVVLRGRCRSCRSVIPWRYPAVEALTASLVMACGLAFGLTFEALVASFFCVVLVAISAIDIEHLIIPNRIVMPAAAVVLVAQTALEPSPEWVLGALAAGGFLFLAALVYPNGMGMGDVKLALLLGAMLGRSVSVALMVALLAALVPAAVLALRHGTEARKMTIPFGPFLALGGVVALFAGTEILDAYLGLFG
jgi:leader peptidase (prepilin peptidase) / N-methyltransferase